MEKMELMVKMVMQKSILVGTKPVITLKKVQLAHQVAMVVEVEMQA